MDIFNKIKSNKKNFTKIIFSIAIIMIVTICTGISVFSVGGSGLTIKFNKNDKGNWEQRWNGQGVFNEKWYSNTKNIQFQLEFDDDFKDILKENISINIMEDKDELAENNSIIECTIETSKNNDETIIGENMVFDVKAILPDDFKDNSILIKIDATLDGHSVSREFKVIVDTIAPKNINIYGVEDNTIYSISKNENVELQLSIMEDDLNNSTVKLIINNEAQELNRERWTGEGEIKTYKYAIDKSGVYNIKLQVTDSANNTTLDSRIIQIIKDMEFEGNIKQSGIYKPGNFFTDGENIINSFNVEKVYYKNRIDGRENIILNTIQDSQKVKLQEINLNSEGVYDLYVKLKNKEPICIRTYTIDGTAPSITGIEKLVDGQIFNADNKEDLKITIDDENLDLESSYIKLFKEGEEKPIQGSGNNTTIIANYTDLKHGNYILKIYAEDKAGNKAGEIEINFKIDTQPPTIILKGGEIELIANKEYYFNSDTIISTIINEELSEGTINVGSSDYKVNYGEGNQCVVTTLTEDYVEGIIQKNGKCKISAKVTDLAGNTTVLENISIVIDKTGPEIDFILDEVDFTNEPIIRADIASKLDIKITDKNLNNTVINIYKEGTEEPIKKLTSTKNLESTLMEVFNLHGENKYKIEVSATDKTKSETKKEISFTIDNTKPEIVLGGEHIKNDQYYKEEFIIDNLIISVKEKNYSSNNVKINITKPNGKVEVLTFEEIKEISNITKKQKADIFTMAGEYAISVEAIDESGNKAQSKDIKFTVDTEDPIINLTNKDNIGFVEEKIFTENTLLIWKISDSNLDKVNIDITENTINELKQYSIEDLEVINGKVNFEKEFKEGKYKVRIIASDKSERKVESEYNFTVDTSGTNIIIDSIVEGKHYNKESTEVKVTLEDTTLDLNNSTIKILCDNVEVYINENTSEGWKISENGMIASLNYTAEKEGDYKITVNSTDKGGNIAAEKIINFTIDKTVPIITIPEMKESGLDNNMYFVQTGEDSSKLTINIKEPNIERIKDLVQIEITKDNKEFIKKELNWKESSALVEGAVDEEQVTFYNFEEGVYKVIVNVTDIAGNIADKKELNFTIDNTKPTISYEGISGNSYNNINKDLNIIIDELNYGNNKVVITAKRDGNEFKLANNWINTGNLSTNIKKLSNLTNTFDKDGHYEINISAIDKAENKAEEKVIKFVIDKTAPNLEIQGFEGGIEDNFKYNHYNTTQNLQLIVKDNNLTIGSEKIEVNPILKITNLKNNVTESIVGKNTWVINKTEATNEEDTMMLEFNFDKEWEQGIYEIEFSYTDRANNTTNYPMKKLVVDSIAPVLDIIGVDNNSFNNKDKKLTLISNEINFKTNTVLVSALKNGDQFGIGTFDSNSVNSSLSYNFNEDGAYVVSIKSTDKANNIAKDKNVAFTIDKTKPSIKISGVENDAHYNTDKSVNIVIVDNNMDINTIKVMKSGQEYNVGEFSIQEIQATLNHKFSKEGDYEIVVNSTDKAGNKNSDSIKFTIDKTAPVITPKIGGKNIVIKNGSFINEIFTPNFQLDKSEDKIVSVVLNGKDNVTGRVPMSSRETKYDYEVVAKDKAGNESKISVSYTVDITKPKIGITGIVDGFFNENITPRYAISDENLERSKTTVTLNGKPFSSGTVLDKEGNYTLKAMATDLANNVTEKTIIFTIDKTAPKIIFEEAISGQYFNDILIPKLFIEDTNSYTIINQTLNGMPYNIGDEIDKDGKYVLFFEVKDSAGNISNNTVEFIIDKTYPEFTINGVKENSKNYKSVILTVSLKYPTDKVTEILLNGEVVEGKVRNENGQDVWEIEVSDISEYELKLVAKDDAGNETIKTFKFEIAEKTLLVKFFENKILLYSTIGLLVIGAIVIIVILFKKKQNNEEDNSNENK